MSDTIEIARANQLVKIFLNRPQSYNALDLATVNALGECLTAFATDDTIRAIILSGRGKAFCSGGDLKWVKSFSQEPETAFHTLAGRLHPMILEIRRMEKPVVAALNGVAAGAGFSLALACDFRVMAKSAVLREAYTSNGLCIDGGGTFMLPRLVGFARALEIAAFDKPISSEQALSLGLVTKVVEDAQVMDEAEKMAIELSQNSLHSFGWSKQLLMDSFHTPFEAHVEHERAGLCACASHDDGREGLLAFAEKRKPVFDKK